MLKNARQQMVAEAGRGETAKAGQQGYSKAGQWRGGRGMGYRSVAQTDAHMCRQVAGQCAHLCFWMEVPMAPSM